MITGVKDFTDVTAGMTRAILPGGTRVEWEGLVADVENTTETRLVFEKEGCWLNLESEPEGLLLSGGSTWRSCTVTSPDGTVIFEMHGGNPEARELIARQTASEILRTGLEGRNPDSHTTTVTAGHDGIAALVINGGVNRGGYTGGS